MVAMALLFVASDVSGGLGTPAQASAQPAHVPKLIEGAKKEGQLNWYTSMSVVVHTKYLELFNEDIRSLK